MSLETQDIETAILDIHEFFTEWVGGRCANDPEIFRKRALDRISDGLVAVFPAGRMFGKKDFEGYMTGIYGSNPDFRIKIRDIRVNHRSDGMAVVNYQEWQRNARDSDEPNNGRITTMVVGEKPSGEGVEILQVHETWLPQDVVEAGDFSF